MQEFQRDLYHQLSFRSRDQHVWRHLEIKLEKLLMPGEVLQRLAGRAPLDQLAKGLDGYGLQWFVRVRDDESSITADGVRQERA